MDPQQGIEWLMKGWIKVTATCKADEDKTLFLRVSVASGNIEDKLLEPQGTHYIRWNH